MVKTSAKSGPSPDPTIFQGGISRDHPVIQGRVKKNENGSKENREGKGSVKPFKCDQCSFSFTRLANMTLHKHKIHNTKTCPVCRIRYSKNNTHNCSGKQKVLIKCSACEFKSDRLFNVKRHFELRHSAQARSEMTENNIRVARLRKSLEVAEHEKSGKKRVQKKVPKIKCWDCAEKFHANKDLMEHIEIDHNPNTSVLSPGESARSMHGLSSSAFGRAICNYMRNFEVGEVTEPWNIFRDSNVRDIIAYELMVHKHIRIYTSVMAMMSYTDPDGSAVRYQSFPFVNKARPLYLSDINNIETFIDSNRLVLCTRMAEFEETEGSGWMFEYIETSAISISKGVPMNVGGASRFNKQLLKYLKKVFGSKSRTLENIKTNAVGMTCFYSSVAQYFYALNKKERRSENSRKTFRHEDALNKFIEDCIVSRVECPVNVKNIEKFEEHNRHLDIMINVFHHDAGTRRDSIYPFKPSSKKQAKHVINLLLIDFKGEKHYMLIRDLDYLVSLNYGSSYKRYKRFVCYSCLQPCSTKVALENHMERCGQNDPQKTIMPKPGDTVKFRSFNKKFRLPIYGVGDFESKMCSPEEGKKHDSEKTSMNQLQKPVSFSLLFVDKLGNIIYQRTDSHENNVMPLFFEALNDAQIIIQEKIRMNAPHNLDKDSVIKLKNAAKLCVICEKPLKSLEEDKHTEGILEGCDVDLISQSKDEIEQLRCLDHDVRNIY